MNWKADYPPKFYEEVGYPEQEYMNPGVTGVNEIEIAVAF